MAKQDKRIADRVTFDHEFEATAVALDGTWAVNGRLHDISESGAKLRLFAAMPERMSTEEFFLMMTPDGKVNRRAKLVWKTKGQVGIHFI